MTTEEAVYLQVRESDSSAVSKMPGELRRSSSLKL